MQKDFSLVLSGEAGQGLKTVELVLVQILKQAGFHLFATKEYMSRIRGGVNTTSIRVSSSPVFAYVNKIDLLISLSRGKTKHLDARVSPGTVVLEEADNMVAAGVVCGLLQVEPTGLDNLVRQYFAAKGEKVVTDNLSALKKGYEKGFALHESGKIIIEIEKNPQVQSHLFYNGAEAVSLGAIAGGCNFIAAYPMSPSTPVFVFLSQHAKEFGIISEQAEDEIAAMNMALGAWFAGARALVNTSGGGFALMVEGLSLAGMLELPLVVHLSQRPGPATGLPTRTEQADLNLALYAGHGEFPRVIFAPGSIEDAFSLTQKAFNLADKYQIPVFVLTDQYLMDSYYNFPELKIADLAVEPAYIKTEKNYQRYVLSVDGISPRGIPGYGEGLVCVDSDEHTDDGHITEDLEWREKIVQKRLAKLDGLAKEALEPKLIGTDDYQVLVVGWGSTYHVIKEALERLQIKELAFLHFGQVYPLPPATLSLLSKAKKVIAIENNATSQFADLIRQKTGFEIKDRINKYNGLPFSVEEIVEKLKRIING